MRAGAKARVKRRDRVVATGLAGAACMGVVGLVAARAEGVGAPVAETQEGLSQEALEAYAEQLTVERARLEWYRSELRRIAAEATAGRSVDSELADWVADQQVGPLVDGASATAPDTATYSS